MTADTTTLLGPAEVRDLLLDVIARHPDAVNPMLDDVRCAYTDPADAERHCLIGQLVAERGWRMPGISDNGNASYIGPDMGWPITNEAADWLGGVQILADTAARNGLPWSTIAVPAVPA